MRFRAKDYAHALLSALSSAPSSEHHELLRRFLAVVRKHGGFSRIGEIARAIEVLALCDRGGHWIELEFARPMGERILGQFRTAVSPRDRMGVSVNPALVAGVRITLDGETELDFSLQKKLKKLFPNGNRRP